ncbi:hypothetical protein [Yoonia sp.]|uniref:hypothetical protein n=1 Tax=Yoonia sp. TaxID=2212373 RepID=UPI00397472D6
MVHSVGRNFLKLGAVALALTTISSAAVIVSTDAAYAERGGKGNGGGGNRDRGRDRSDRAERGNNGNGNGRGAIASELRGLNAAHANPRAMENASPDSMPGKLYIYQQAQQEYAGLADAEADALAEYERLISLTEEEIAVAFPEGGYEDAITDAEIAYYDAQADAVDAEADIETSLVTLTDGQDLSDDALAELNRLLGL